LPLSIDYVCDDCGMTLNNKQMKSMICLCGGEFRPDGLCYTTRVSKFEPHFCPTLHKWLTSWKHQEQEAKKFRSPRHPEGFVMLQDNKKYLNECKKTVKNREDIIAKTYSEDGIKYPKGKHVHWDDGKKTFVNKVTKEPINRKTYSVKQTPLRISEKLKKVAVVIALLATSLATNATATDLKDVDGLRWIDVTVNGKTYSVPEHKDEFFGEKVVIWLKAIDGDVYSRKYLIGNSDKATLFMGDGSNMNRWLHMTMDKVWVVE